MTSRALTKTFLNCKSSKRLRKDVHCKESDKSFAIARFFVVVDVKVNALRKRMSRTRIRMKPI